MSDTNQNSAFREQNLTVRDHEDPDKHYIGGSLPIPTQSEIAATVGSVSAVGNSPIPARADHAHKVDPLLLPRLVGWTPTISNHTLGTGGSFAARAHAQRIVGSATSKIWLSLHIAYGTGGGPTGDMSFTLPYSSLDRAILRGYAEATLRMDLSIYVLGTGGGSALIRPMSYRPTDATAIRPIENAVQTMAGITPAQTWGSGSFIMIAGDYITVEVT